MSDDERWRSWLYETHSATELHDWALRLRYFRFCRAVGGHANDGDNLRVVLRAETEPALRNLFTVLGITPTTIPPDAPRPQPGTRYTVTQYAAFPARIDRFPTLAQPAHVHIAGHKAFAWAYAGRLRISLHDADNPFEVTEPTVQAALDIEQRLSQLAAEIIDPPIDNRHCICPKYYGELWE